MTTLVISHNVFLTKKQRYKWYNGDNLTVIGVNTPVWYCFGLTSEPGVEVFCKYQLTCKNEEIHIKTNNYGYEIVAPKNSLEDYNPPPNKIWQNLTQEEQEKWYELHEPKPAIANLLDLKDGGAAWLSFRQYGKLHKDHKTMTLAHFVEIKDMDALLNSFI